MILKYTFSIWNNSPFSIWNYLISVYHAKRRTGEANGNALSVWGKKRHFYPRGLEQIWVGNFRSRREIAIKSTVIRQARYLYDSKLATQSEWKCARHSTDDEYRARSTMRSSYVRRARRVRARRYYFHWQGAAWIENRILIPHDSDETLTRRSAGTIRTLGTLRWDSKGFGISISDTIHDVRAT